MNYQIQQNGLIIINTNDPNSEGITNLKNSRPDAKIAIVDATKIAAEEIGIKVTNTAILGALIKLTNEEIIRLESLKKAIQARFKGEKGSKNVRAVERSYNEVN